MPARQINTIYWFSFAIAYGGQLSWLRKREMMGFGIYSTLLPFAELFVLIR